MDLLTKFGEIVFDVAQHVGEGVDYFWPIFVRQQFIYGALSIGAPIFFSVLLVICYK